MKHIVVGTAGHIDHGKSALVRALTGIDPDRLKEEQERGITIDLGFAHWQVEDLTFAFVDVPGHERFVKNMLAGVGGMDLVMLVVAADESVMPQTREHFEICRLLHVPSGLIVLTKADLVDAETIELVKLETRELVAGSFLQDAPALPVSSTTGQGLEALREALLACGRQASERPGRMGAPRLPIDRVFSIKGFGTVVTGTLVAGEIAQDQELMLLPGQRPAKVRGLQVHGHREDRAHAGQRVAVNLGGVEVAEVSRGDTLLAPGTLADTKVFDGVLEMIPGARPLRHGTRVRFHQGTREVLGRVALGPAVVWTRDKTPATGTAAEAQPGSEVYVRLRLEAPAVLTRGDRYILRAYSPPVTIAGGQVLDPSPPRTGIRTPAAAARFACLDARPGSTAASSRQDAEDQAVAAMIREADVSGLSPAKLISRAGVAPSGIAAMIERLSKRRLAVMAGEVLVAPPVIDDLATRLLAAVAAHHRAEPLTEGMPREEARERLFARAGPGVFEHVLARLAAEQRLTGRDRLALAGHRLALSPEEERARSGIERLFLDAGLKPPEASEIPGALGIRPDIADRMVKLLVRQKTLVRVETHVFHEKALERLREDVAELKRSAGATSVRLDVAAFKERYGLTRKYAIPLLEYLDRERLTRRVGEGRVLI